MQIYIDKIKRPFNRLIVSVVLSSLLAVQSVREWLMTVHPVSLVPVITLLQMALFLHFVLSPQKDMLFYLAGNVAVVSAALIPSTLSRPSTHWVK